MEQIVRGICLVYCVTLNGIRANSSREILIAPQVGTADPPTLEERRILHEIDPVGMAIGK